MGSRSTLLELSPALSCLADFLAILSSSLTLFFAWFHVFDHDGTCWAFAATLFVIHNF
jgi:hypothetical protein